MGEPKPPDETDAHEFGAAGLADHDDAELLGLCFVLLFPRSRAHAKQPKWAISRNCGGTILHLRFLLLRLA